MPLVHKNIIWQNDEKMDNHNDTEFKESRGDFTNIRGHVSGQGQVKGQNRVFSGCRL